MTSIAVHTAVMRRPPATIDDYLAPLPAAQRAALQKLRAAIHATAPGLVECIKYGVPTFCRDDRNLVHFGAAKGHCSFFPGPSPIELFAEELAGYSTSKGTIRFAAERPLPIALVRKIVRARIAEQDAETAAKGRGTKKKGRGGR